MTDSGATVGGAFFIETYGCQMNVYDSAAIAGMLERAGFERAAVVEDAVVVLLNTCSVREHAEHRIMSRVGELRRSQREGGRCEVIGICGCMAERLGEALLDSRRAFDIAVGVDRYDRLPALIDQVLDGDHGAAVTGHDPDTHYVAPPEEAPINNSHLVTIHKGCDYKCTYCIVPYTRGPQVEKAPEVILDEIRTIVAAGGREVTLLGQNVTAYDWRASATRLDFAGLLRRVVEESDVRRVRFLTGHPHDMHEALLQTIADLPAVCPSLHVPMQSGSDSVLRRMKRLYKRDDYFAMVDRARELIGDVSFAGDFMVGFPGETEEDFEATLEAVGRVRYDQLFLFKYSERPGVPAVKFGDDVSDKTKKRRLAELTAAQEAEWSKLAAQQVGQRWTVVVEAPARRDQDAWRGRSAANRKVVFTDAAAVIGDEIEVEIDDWRNTTFRGRPVERAR